MMAPNRRRLGRYVAPRQRMWLEIAGQHRLRRLQQELTARRAVLHRWSALLDDLDQDVSRRLQDLGGDEDSYDAQSHDVNEPLRTRYPDLGKSRRHAGDPGHELNLSRVWAVDDDDDLEDDFDDEEDEAMSKPAVETYYENGTWRSRHQGVTKPFASGGTKAEQVARGRETARREGVEHIIKNRDGSISERNSYGADPHPPRG